MVAYIYYTSTLIINTKVDNVQKIIDKEIIGANVTGMFDGGSDYIVLKPIQLIKMLEI